MKRWHDKKSINKMLRRQKEWNRIVHNFPNDDLGHFYTQHKLGCRSSKCWCKSPFDKSIKITKADITYREQINEI